MEVFSKSHYYGQNSSQQEVHSALLKTNIFEKVGCKDYSLNNGSEKKVTKLKSGKLFCNLETTK